METRICLLDDDEIVRDSLQALFRSRRLRVSVFDDPERFFSIWTTSELREIPAVFIIDVRMPRLSGTDLFARMRAHGMPDHNAVIFLSGHGDIPLAVAAMRDGAFDFVEKPSSDNSLVDRVVLAASQCEKSLADRSRVETLTALLSPREKDVALLIRQGMTNKQIATQLNIATRTVEVHRAVIFDKLEVRNAVELALSLSPEALAAGSSLAQDAGRCTRLPL